VGISGRLEGRFRVGEAIIGRIQPLQVRPGGGVVDAQDRPGAVKPGDDPETRRPANVVCIRLERHAEDTDDLVPQHPQRPLDLRK